MQSQTLALTLLAVGLAASAVEAQNALGYRIGAGSTNQVTRGFVDRNEETLTRIDASDYAGIGATAGGTELTGAIVTVYDFVRDTQDPFSLVVRTEGGANVPDNANPPAVQIGPVALNGTGGGGGALLFNFNTPATLPAGQDIFVGVACGPATDASVGDALWSFTVRSTTASRRDEPGPAYNPAETYATVFDLTNSQLFAYQARYMLVDVLSNSAGGVVTAVTNQTTMPSSNAAPGIAGPLSGLHPNLGDGTGVGRADAPGFVYTDATMAGQNVFFQLSGLGFDPNPVLLSTLVPGSTGTRCLNDLGLTAAAVVADANGVATFNIAVPAAVAAAVTGSGLALQYQAVAYDGVRLSSSPCAQQTY